MQLARPLHDPLAADDSEAGQAPQRHADAMAKGALADADSPAQARAYTPGAEFDFADIGVGLGGTAAGDGCRRDGWEGGLPAWEGTFGAECVSLNALGEVLRWRLVQVEAERHLVQAPSPC